ncbi:mannose-1-phosphate guanylyltransferase [Clostridium tertium]|uniref:mannose-1-phosphate guanylyltransferase n=1 Tax=Clostridium tertium TaxID=1559 RepID=UPI0028FEE788|nr:mannose-1-phosphate guanylyltransferase [Clostridium sp.]
MNICALIMAGGKGTRFWPLSTEEKPKQFLNLVGNKTMIQMTIDRILPIIPIERIFVCTGEKYINLLKEQIPNLPDKNIIVEPEGRNTAPCIALSAFVIKRYYKDSTMVVLPSDHLINDENKFRDLLKIGSDFLEYNSDGILTLGMKPDRPETGYGYIQFGDDVKLGVKKVNKFVEKPDLHVAKQYLEEGTYLWNGGMFLWKTEHILNEIKRYVPNTYEVLHNVANVDEKYIENLINTNYSRTDSISIDYAVLEKSNNIFVLPSEIGWDDIGTWSSVERYGERDSNNNITLGSVIQFESNDNIIISADKPIILDGVKNLYIIESDERIIIGNKRKLDNINKIKDRI